MMAVIEEKDCYQPCFIKEEAMNNTETNSELIRRLADQLITRRSNVRRKKGNRINAAVIQLLFPFHPVKFSIHIFIKQYQPG